MFYFFIILFIFLVFDFFSKFYFSSLFFGILFSFPLFIKDLINREKGIFNKYGFWIFCGLGGSGKTLSMVHYLYRMKRKFPKVKIYTNFNFIFSDGIITDWNQLIDLENIEIIELSNEEYTKLDLKKRDGLFTEIDSDGVLHYFRKINHGIIFALDEIHMTFESGKWQTAPDNLLYYISQQRKLHKQIVSSSQVFTRVNIKLREQTNFVIECKSLLLGRLIINKYYYTEEYIANDEKKDKGSRKRKTIKRQVIVAVDRVRAMYDTFQVMKDLKVSKSKDKQLVDLIKSYSKED